MHDIHDNDPGPGEADFPLVGRPGGLISYWSAALPSIYSASCTELVEEQARDSRPSIKLSEYGSVCVCLSLWKLDGGGGGCRGITASM
jgi:hypothetical protein